MMGTTDQVDKSRRNQLLWPQAWYWKKTNSLWLRTRPSSSIAACRSGGTGMSGLSLPVPACAYLQAERRWHSAAEL